MIKVIANVSNINLIPSKLNELAEEYTKQGYKVRRTFAGIIVLKLDDGEVHIYPEGNLIKMRIAEVECNEKAIL